MYGQKRHPKDVKTQPQDEFITQTSNNLSEAAKETPVKPGAARPDGLEASEIEAEGLVLPAKATPANNQEQEPGPA